MSEAKLGHYRLGRRLGSGGMAEVYEAIAERAGGLEQRCVIKRVLPHLLRERTLVNMFATEARLTAQLQHPNIVQVFDFGEAKGAPYLAMEYVEGVDLAALFARAQAQHVPFGIDFVCYVVSQVATGLDYAHRRKNADGRPLDIVHRDVSPSNIMVTTEGAVKLLDFGIAKVAAHLGDVHKTSTGLLKGKVSYMSPQQAAGEDIDHRSDQFSLGIVFYECLTGTRLFHSDDRFRNLRMIREVTPAAPSSLRHEIPPELDEIVMRLLAHHPDDRFGGCGELVDALAPLVHRHHADARLARRVVIELRGSDTTIVTPPAPERHRTPVESTARIAIGEVRPSSHVWRILSSNTGFMRYTRPALVAITSICLVLAALFGGKSRPVANVEPLGDEASATARPLPPALLLPPPAEGEPMPAQAPPPPPPAARPLSAAIQLLAEGGPPPPPPPRSAARRAAPPSPRLGGRANADAAGLTPAWAKVTLHVVGTEGAQVWDGARLLGTIPFDVDVDVSDQPRRLIARKPGYLRLVRDIAGDTSARIELRLRRKGAARPGQIRNPYES